MEILNDIKTAFLPELILIIFIILNIILSLFVKKFTYKTAKIINIIALTAVFISMWFIQITPVYYAFNKSFLSNAYTLSFKMLILICAMFFMLSSNYLIKEKIKKSFEFFSIVLTAVLSAFSLISSNDFLSMFISLEMLSLCCYILTASRNTQKSKEASVKYLITGACASMTVLLGVSYLYGITGQINFDVISLSLKNGDISIFFVVSSVLIILGLMFKLALLPFNNWIIDIYEGSNYNICLFISLIPKIASIGILARLYMYVFAFSPILKLITALLALMSLFYSAIGGIKQANIKKIYAYSSIMHSSFIMLTLSLMNIYALSSVIFYLITYIFMNTGAWIASIVYNSNYKSDYIKDYKGLFNKHPYFTSAFSICLISLAGLPPTAGFIAKIYIFTALAKQDLIYVIFMLLALIASVIALFIYLKIIKVMFEKQNLPVNLTEKFKSIKFILYFCSFITVVICFIPSVLIKLSELISQYI